MVGVTLRMPLAAIEHFLQMDKANYPAVTPRGTAAAQALVPCRPSTMDRNSQPAWLVPDRDQSRGDDGFHGPDGPLLGGAKRPRAEEHHEIN